MSSIGVGSSAHFFLMKDTIESHVSSSPLPKPGLDCSSSSVFNCSSSDIFDGVLPVDRRSLPEIEANSSGASDSPEPTDTSVGRFLCSSSFCHTASHAL